MDLKDAQNTARSSRRYAVFFTVASFGVAVAFAWFLAQLMGKSYGSEPLFPVVVAATKVPALRLIEQRHLKLVRVPEAAVPDDSYASLADALERSRLTLTGLVAGEPVIATRLASPEDGIGMALAVPPNMRAFAVRVNDAIATAQMLRPGVFVDVVATFVDPTTRTDVTKLVLQNVEVLGVGRDVAFSGHRHGESRDALDAAQGRSLEKSRKRVVTLLVRPHDVEYLAHVTKGSGSIDLALRSGEDDAVVTTRGVSVRDILGMPAVSSSSKQKDESSVSVREVRRPRPRPRPSPADKARNKAPTIIKVR
jgi:pilus assembly protein CpaB